MVLKSAIAGLALSLLAAPALAEVVSQTADGFTLRYQVVLETTPEDIWISLGRIGDWWEDAHTYSGDAANMTIELKPGGCFCEALPGGGVRHGEVVMAWPERMLRLYAALGPLQATDPAAALTFEWATEGGGQTLTATYVVAGPGLGAFAGGVDGVLKTQFDNLARHIERGE